MAEEQVVTALKTIDVNATEFEANGKIYRRADSISLDRFTAYQKLEVELSFGQSFAGLYAGLQEAYSLCNASSFADLAVKLRDMMQGVKSMNDGRLPIVLKMCALFLNRDGEDVRFIDEALIASKVDDWRKEGIAMTYFFALALHSIPGLISAYSSITPATSAHKSERRAEKPFPPNTGKDGSSK